MRALPIAVAALAAALVLTACDDDSGSDSSSHSSSNGGKKTSTACAIDRLGIQVGPANTAPAAGDTGDIPVTVTNRGEKCTLEGFPGIEVQGSDGTGTDIPALKSAKAEKLTLAKDDPATFTITYVRGEPDDAKTLDVKTLKISLAGASSATQSFKWSYGPVASKGEAGDLNASVSAFQTAGD